MNRPIPGRIPVMLALMCSIGCQGELTKGKLYMRDGQDEEALDYLEQARTKRPDDPEVPFLIGTIHARRGDYLQMNQAFERSLALGDDHSLGVDRVKTDYFTNEYNRGVTILQGATADYAVAIGAFTAATIIDPEQAAGWRNLGYAYFKLDSLSAAATAYEAAARADAGNPTSWFDLGTAQLANQDYAKAATSLRAPAGIGPATPRRVAQPRPGTRGKRRSASCHRRLWSIAEGDTG